MKPEDVQLDVELEKRIAEIRERESKATKGPYSITGGNYLGIIAVIGGERTQIGRAEGCGDRLTDEQVEDNARFFAHARQDIPFLLEQLALLRRVSGKGAQTVSHDSQVCPDCGKPVWKCGCNRPAPVPATPICEHDPTAYISTEKGWLCKPCGRIVPMPTGEK